MFINGIRYYGSEEVEKVRELRYDAAVGALSDIGFTCVKCSLRRGYMKKGRGQHLICKVVPYDGRYGIGYCLHVNYDCSTQYHIVEYWVKEV